MRTLLVASQKGGVGKTTTALNLAAAAASAGQRVLVLDADPLGSVAASLHLARPGADTDDRQADRDPVAGRGAFWAAAAPGLDVVSPYPDGDTADDHLRSFLAALPGSTAAGRYDLLVIDAPPMLGPRPEALLRAADDVLVVQRAEPMSFRTLPAYLELLKKVRGQGAAVKLAGILLTLPTGTPPGGKAEQKLREKFPGLLPHAIPHDPEVNRALVRGEPLVLWNAESPAARRYRALAEALNLTPALVPAGAATPPPRGFTPAFGLTDVDDEPLELVAEPARPAERNRLRLPPDAKAAPATGMWLAMLFGVVVSAAGAGLLLAYILK